ncbi:uncharacterized protein BO96DRAFT_438802 [Aspergillus niger CBS 101883]|uniref:Hydrophobin n=1 Tax=Aspergillus niger ATCC 13496 TaxID=1353008 RepID=A0A370CBZ0_ASPNG|nr:uncharacterized protein BO96DRAFT_438802 [Aspergillus niger CBS 101883]PYH51546.1 hypothetical protein BO96DRAFT_438802 [Aspergillus niger CBS 101883]RDH23720.1 hypothetical protein M747DRAFT_293494 [Aspergillus niger ATCC 13496]
MKTFISTDLLFLIASSSSFAVAQSSICPKGTSPKCCADDVLGSAADSICNDPPRQPTDGADLSTICGDIGQEASCCYPPAYGQQGICSLVADA